MAETVTDRRIGPIRDLARNNSWKQALKECEKWQKKGEKSDRFLALKAFVLTNQPDENQKRKGEAETLQLCQRTPAVIDLEAIDDLQYALKHLSLQQEQGTKVWERAAASNTKDKNLLTAWLNTSVADSNWRSAQKATTALRNAFPKERQYEFWNILMCFLVFKDESIPEKERTMFGTLAYRMIKKAAETVPEQVTNDLAPGKAIATFDELDLLIQIYVATNNTSEASDVLCSNKLGMSSQIFQQDSGQGYTLLVNLLSSEVNRNRALDICEDVLQRPEMQDHEALWQTYGQLHDGVDSLPIPGRKPFEPLMEPKTRAAHKTYLQITHCLGMVDELHKSATSYLRQNMMKSYCFDDMGRMISTLDDEEEFWAQFDDMRDPATIAWITLFRLKYIRTRHQKNPTADTLLTRADQGLAILHSSKDPDTKNLAVPEAGLLAAIDLMRAAAVTGKLEYNMQATLLLEVCRSKDQSYYPSSITLVLCYLSLGLLSLALEVFESLSVKNLQWESVGWLLLSRISTMHPHQTGSGPTTLNPLGALEASIRAHQKSVSDIGDGIFKGLRHGAYGNIINSVALLQELKQSLNSHNYKLEERRIKRLLSPASVDSVLEASPDRYSDKRDMTILPSMAPADRGAYQVIGPNPLPGVFWTNAMSATDHLVSFFKFSTENRTELADVSLQRYQHCLQRCREESQHPCRELSHIENSMWQCVQRMDSIINTIVNDTQPTVSDETMHWFEAELREILDKSDDRHNGVATASAGRLHRVAGVTIPGWEFLHTSYTQLEICNFFFYFLQWIRYRLKSKEKEMKRKGSWDPLADHLAKFDKLISDIEKKVQDGAKQVKQNVNEGGVLGKLVDVVLAREEGHERMDWTDLMGKLADEAIIETIVGRWKESWDDALDGIGMVKAFPGRKK